ncbi:hypothetical protein [Telluribacter humicola]|uniref:hypothetical protein n=1 Tax=Telluribacter humicola TaxID=1720261 RepID=UPI001A979102|nr:hypothetical protein [Telluribacter humicola]
MTDNLTADQKDQVLSYCIDIADENRQVELYLDDLQDIVPVDEHYLFKALNEFRALGLIAERIQILGLGARTSPIAFTLSELALQFDKEGGFNKSSQQGTGLEQKRVEHQNNSKVGAFLLGLIA